MRMPAVAVGLALACIASADDYFDLNVGDQPWLRTVTLEYQPRGPARDETYKVYTQVYDFAGDRFLTKGTGGLYPHHRGLFIGWMKTTVGNRTVDTWHMRGSYQAHVEWLEQSSGEAESRQVEVVEWRDHHDTPFIRETRSIVARPGDNGVRVIDFESTLEAIDAAIQLRGDLQHAGMQIRLDNEVSEHPDTTQYILPESATAREDDEVVGAWWACCSAVIGGKRYWFVHMTPPDHPTGIPVYSIRPYGRFGAFSEHDLAPGQPLDLNYRIVVSETPLDRFSCDSLYAEYASERETE